MMFLVHVGQLDAILACKCAKGLKLVGISAIPLSLTLLSLAVVLIRIVAQILDLKDLIEYYLYLHGKGCFLLLLIDFDLLTNSEFVVFHVYQPILKLIYIARQIALEHQLKSIVSRALQELILVSFVSQVLRVLSILIALLVEADLRVLINWEGNLL
jgi:hypothetical protein